MGRLYLRDALFTGPDRTVNAQKLTNWCRNVGGDASLVFEVEPPTSDGTDPGGPRVRVIYVVPPDMDGTDSVKNAVRACGGTYLTRPDID